MNIKGDLLVKNTGLTFIARLVPMLVALVTIPYVIHGLGTERFGVLSLAWLIVGSASIFDFGIGRATTKFVAEALGKNQTDRVSTIVWTSIASQVTLGIVAGIFLYIFTPLLTSRILKISPSIEKESALTFALLSLAIPVVLCTKNLSGVLEAMQRFDLITCIQIPSSSFTALLPAIGVFFGLKLPAIMLLIVGGWMASVGAYLYVCLKVLPSLRTNISADRKLMRSLLSFGGWVTVCNILVPILVSSDRFLIGALLSVRELAYYIPPYEMAFRLLIIPGVLGTIVFPAFSTLAAINESRLGKLYFRTLLYVLVLMGPMVVTMILFAGTILEHWLGKGFAAESTTLFQILLLGMLFNGLAQIPATLLDGIGRPDVRAKIFLCYLLPYVVLAYILIMKMGILGAAVAWTIRAGIECGLFFVASWKLKRFKLASVTQSGFFKGVVALGCLVVTATAIRGISNVGLLVESSAGLIMLGLFATGIWRFVLDETDKRSLLKFAVLPSLSSRQ